MCLARRELGFLSSIELSVNLPGARHAVEGVDRPRTYPQLPCGLLLLVLILYLAAARSIMPTGGGSK